MKKYILVVDDSALMSLKRQIHAEMDWKHMIK